MTLELTPQELQFLLDVLQKLGGSFWDDNAPQMVAAVHSLKAKLTKGE